MPLLYRQSRIAWITRLGLICAIFIWLLMPKAFAQESTFAKLYQTEKPSVVYIVSALPSGAASGSGFIYSSTGSTSTIITANHVVEGATHVDVILDSDVHERYPATVIQRDHVRDVAVLTIPIGNRRALALFDPTKLQEGTDVAVIGYPRVAAKFETLFADDLRPSVHMGIISAVRLNGEVIQFDAQTDHGDSGGPVIDKASGAVVGIVRGSILDDTYRARGLEQPLPGSNFGMSVATINQVLRGAPPAANVASAASTGPANPTLALNTGGASVGLGQAASNAASSAAYRVGYGAPHFVDANAEAISQSVLQRLAGSFTDQNAFYMIPVTFGITKNNGQQLSGICDDNRLNAIVQPAVGWRTSGMVYNATGNPTWIAATVSLLITDCSGGRIFAVQKSKTEDTLFANRTPAKEIVDMSNDLLDQALRDFSKFRTANAGAWDSLLKTGVFVDPSDGKFHSLFTFEQNPQTHTYRVASVSTNGPAAQGGLQVGDSLVSINGTALTNLPLADVSALTNAAQLDVVVLRPGGQTSLTISPKKYAELVSTLRR